MCAKRWFGFLFAAVAVVGLLGVGWHYSSPAFTRGPYLQESTPTSIVIRWRTARPARTAVRYGLSPDQLALRETSHMADTDHGVRLSALQPGTRYYYTIDAPHMAPWRKPQTHSFVTPPQSGSPAPVRIWVLGDSGTQRREQRAVREAFYQFSRPRPADLWLMLGDNAYRKGTDTEYQNALFDFYSDLLCAAPLWPTLGNHDARSADSATQTGVYFDIFNLPAQGQCGGVMSGTEAYYAFDHADIHFVCLDSEGSDRSPDGPMLTWLKQDLARNQQPWTVAFWHQPPYTKGSHDSDKESPMQEMRAHALPILEAAGVDLVLSGHSHTYERSYLLDGHYGSSDTFSGSMIKNRGDGRPDGSGPFVKPAGNQPHAGTVYVVAGSSGQSSRLNATPHPAMCVSLNVAGSLVLDVAGLRLDARFLDESGHVRDHFVILKEQEGGSGHGG